MLNVDLFQTRVVVPGALFLLVLSGCGSGDPSTSTPLGSVHDSSGVVIATSISHNDAPIAFRIRPAPDLHIGGNQNGPPAELTTHHSNHHAVRLSDGQIVVTDLTHLKFFGPDGDFLYLVGGPGEGPGEFPSLRAVCLAPGDTIFAISGGGRVSVFSSEGDHVRTFKKDGWRVSDDSCFPDGSMLLKGPRQPNPLSNLSAMDAIMLDPVAEVRQVGPDGSELGVVGVFPEGMLSPFFQSTGNVVVHADRVFVGSGRTPEVRVYTAQGELTQVIRWDQRSIPVTDEVLEGVVRGTLREGATEGEFNVMLARARSISRPPELPLYSGLKVDPLGRLWIQGYHHFSSPDPSPWTVFDSSGVLLGRVLLPEIPGSSGLEIQSIGAEEVLLRWTDVWGFVHLSSHSFNGTCQRH